MARVSIKLWFCLVVAVAAAAIADPLVEAASNAGWFGPGHFTDHSNVDVVPALALSIVFVGVYLASRLQMPAHVVTAGTVWKLLPIIYVAQIATLYFMESCEQYFVAGHLLSSTAWLGGPVAISLCAHAASCALSTFLISRLLEVLYGGTVQLARLVRVIVTRTTPSSSTSFVRIAARAPARPSLCALCRLGERAPPFVTA
jgi:hypothetical protein